MDGKVQDVYRVVKKNVAKAEAEAAVEGKVHYNVGAEIEAIEAAIKALQVRWGQLNPPAKPQDPDYDVRPEPQPEVEE